jgi:putative ABC transport system permease protein
MVTPGKRLGPGQSSDTVPFKMSDAEAIARDVRSIAAVAPVSSRSLQAVSGNENWSTNVTGTDNSYFKVTNRSVRSGRTFGESELRSGARSASWRYRAQKTLRQPGSHGREDPSGEAFLQGDRCA